MTLQTSMNRSLELSRKAFNRAVSVPRVLWRYGKQNTDNAERFIFHHIPKCAGTSAVDLLRQWFHVRTDYPTGWADEDDPLSYRQFLSDRYEIESFRSHELLAGHFHIDGSYLDQRYPDWSSQGYKAFTFLRDPLELRISLYKYEIRNNRYPVDEPIEKQILTKPNYIAARLPCDESNFATVLNKYFFIGLVDEYQLSFDILADLLGRPRLKVGRLNASKPGATVVLSDAVISEFKALNALDYKIYDYGRAHFYQGRWTEALAAQ